MIIIKTKIKKETKDFFFSKIFNIKIESFYQNFKTNQFLFIQYKFIKVIVIYYLVVICCELRRWNRGVQKWFITPHQKMKIYEIIDALINDIKIANLFYFMYFINRQKRLLLIFHNFSSLFTTFRFFSSTDKNNFC